jgi:hypothetical protein
MRWLPLSKYRRVWISTPRRKWAFAIVAVIAVIASWFARHTLLPFVFVAAAFAMHYVWVSFEESSEVHGRHLST